MKNIMANQNPCVDEKDRISYSSLHLRSEEINYGCKNELGSSSTCGFFNGKRGIPRKCVCGSGVTIYTFKSKANPGRPYFRCAFTREDGHLFKWVEDGMYEEVEDMLQKNRIQEFNVNELMVDVQNVKEEVSQCKIELKRSRIKNMVLVVCCCALAFLLIYHMFHVGNKLVFGH